MTTVANSTALTINQLFALIACNMALGTDRKFVLPNLDGEKAIAAHPELAEAWGDMGAIINAKENEDYFLNPKEVVCSDALEQNLVDFTSRVMGAALATEGGYPGIAPKKGANPTEVWNLAVEDFSTWLSVPVVEAVETPVAETVDPVEVEPVALTQAEAEAVVEAIADTPEGETALENAVAIAEAATGLAMTEDAAIAYLSGQQVLNAHKTSRQMSGVAEDKIGNALELLIDAFKLVKGDNAFKDALISKLEAPVLTEVTESEEVAA